MASTLASLCLSQKGGHFEHTLDYQFVFSVLMNFSFTPCLMQRMLLRQHYKSLKRYVLFSQGSVRTLVRRGGHFFIHE